MPELSQQSNPNDEPRRKLPPNIETERDETESPSKPRDRDNLSEQDMLLANERHVRKLTAVLDKLNAERSELARQRRLGNLSEINADYLRDLEEQINALELQIAPPPALDLLQRLEVIAQRVARRAGAGE